MIWKPNVTVAAVIKQDDKYLLVEEQTKRGVLFNQPAGHLESNESIVHSVIRETLEETAYSSAENVLTQKKAKPELLRPHHILDPKKPRGRCPRRRSPSSRRPKELSSRRNSPFWPHKDTPKTDLRTPREPAGIFQEKPAISCFMVPHTSYASAGNSITIQR